MITQSDDLQAIRNLKARYCRLLDTRQWEAWEALFAPDAILTSAGNAASASAVTHVEGRAAIRAKVQTIQGPGIVSVHHVHEPELALTSADTATGIWAMDYLMVWTESVTPPGAHRQFHGYGHYTERYRKMNGAWSFARVDISRLHATWF